MLGHQLLEPRHLLATFTNAASIDIPDIGTGPGEADIYPSNIVAAGQAGLVSSVSVTLHDLTHTHPDDVHVLLVGPGGEQVYLMGDQGGPADVAGIDLTFRDDAAGSLPDGSALVSGEFRPQLAGASPIAFPAPAPAASGNVQLSTFKGTNPNGLWRLFIFDDASADVGMLAGGWSLNIITDVAVNAGPGDNTIELRRNGANYEVEIDGVVNPQHVFPAAFTSSITIHGEGGDDTLVLDSSNGLIALSEGTYFDGGAGDDQVVLRQTSGPALASTEYSPGPNPGQGESIVAPDGGGPVQRLVFENLAPVFDFLPAPTITVNATPADNAINYTSVPLLFAVGGEVSIDNLETVTFTSKDNLVINAGAGSDTINLNGAVAPTGFTPGGLKGITVNGEDPTASDTVVVNGSAGADAITASGFTADGAVVTGAQPMPVVVATAEHLIIDGQGGGDTLTLEASAAAETIVHRPGAAGDEGGLRIDNLLPLSYEALGLTGGVAVDGQGGDDQLVVLGTALGDAIDVLATTGAVEMSNSAAAYLTLAPLNVEVLAVEGLEGDDRIAISSPQPYEGMIVAGGGGGDTLSIQGELGADEQFTVQPDFAVGQGEITAGALPVAYSGAEHLLLTGNAGDDDDLSIEDDSADNVWTVAAGPIFGDRVQIDDRESIDYDDFEDVDLTNNFGSDQFVVHPAELLGAVTLTLVADGDGDDAVEVVGTNAADDFLATFDTIDLAGGVPVTLDNSGDDFALVKVSGLAGDDELSIDVAGTQLLTPAVLFDGGAGADQVTILGAPIETIDAVTYLPGPAADRGRIEYDTDDAGADANMVVEFASLEPVVDLVPAAVLIVAGTNADNAIDYRQSDINPLLGMVSVDAFEAIHFANKAELRIEALAGSDEIQIGSSITPADLVLVSVNAGPPAGSDRLVVTSIPGVDDALNHNPTAQGAGTVVSTGGLPDTVFTGVEHLVLAVQQADGDEAEVNGTAGDDQFEFTPGLTSDTGLFTGEMDQTNVTGVGPFAMTPTTFVGANVTDDLDVNASGAIGGADTFIFNGTAHDDEIVALPTAGGVVGDIGIMNLVNAILFSFIDVHNIDSARIRGGDGDDFFTHDAAILVDVAYEGGDPSASDSLEFVGTGGAITIDLAAMTIQEAGQGLVSLSGIESVNVDAQGGDVTVNATLADDRIVWSPSGGDAGVLQVDLLNTVFQLSLVGALTIDGLAGDDTIRVNGSSDPDEIDVSDAAITFAAGVLQGVDTVAGFESLEVFGLAGSDIFNVDPSAAAPIFIDGGDPIGVVPGDVLNIVAGGDPVMFFPGPENDEGGFQVGANAEVSFDHIETVGPVDGAPCVIIVGTNADDDITVIARDDSTHPAADGVQDFTVTVNDGPEILYLNTAMLFIDGLAGDDDIVLRTPAPNNAVWDVDVFVAGGPPSASTGDQGDVFLLETPLGQTVHYTPTGSDSGRIDIVTLSSLITLGSFVDACPPIDYDSSPGGIELFVYDGEAGDDDLRIVGSAGDDVIVHSPGAAADEGSLRVGGLLGVSYQNLGAAATLAVDGAGGDDTLTVLGTALGDTMSVQAVTGAVTLSNSIATHLPIQPTSIEFLALEGLEGDDRLTVNLPQPYERISALGGGPGGSDVFTVNGAVGVDEEFTVSPEFANGDGVVDVNGLAMPYVGIEHILLDANSAAGDSDNLTVLDDLADNLWTVMAGPIFGDRIRIDSRETIDYDDFDNVTLENQIGEDRFVVHPTQLAGVASTLTVAADIGAIEDDVVEIVGTNAADTVTSTADAVTVNGAVPVVIAALGDGFAEFRLLTLAGADNIDLDLGLPGVNKLVDGGDGNDGIDLSGTSDADIFGGLGDDNILGTPLADNIYGGAGNDTINAGGGDDTIYSGEGNDNVRGNGGADRYFGGDGSDVFTWNPGDGSDLVEGGAGEADKLVFNGAAAAEVFHIFASTVDPSRAVLFRDVGAITMDIAGVEEIDLNALGGADTVTVGRASAAPNALRPLDTTEVKVVDVDLGAGDAAADNLFVDGRALDDNLLVSNSGGVINVAGLPYVVLARNSVAGAGGDRLTVRGNEGDDILKSHNPSAPGVGAAVELVINITLDGGDGDDQISADAILIGGPGDDFLEGGAGDDQLFGGDGEDVMIGGAGADTFDGGAGFDVILIRGTKNNDQIDVFQTAATTLVHTVNGNTQTDTLVTVAGVRTVEGARVESGDGDDLIRVSWADALGVDATVNSLRYDVDAGAGFTRDRLGVFDDLVGDLLLYRKGESSLTGSVTIGPANAEPLEVSFTGVELTQPIAAAGGDVMVFKFDPFEFNDARTLAVHLGANDAINVDPTIDGTAVAASNNFAALPADQDFYRVVAETTGVLDFQVYFRQLANVGSGRPALPAAGDLQIEVLDAAGNVIAGFGANDATSDERVRIPAIAGQTYFLRVFGVPNAINIYNITVDNYAPPTPYDLELRDQIDLSTITAVTSATVFRGGATLSADNDFYNGKFVEFTSGPLAGQRALINDYNGATKEFTVAATLSAAPAVGAAFQVESHDTGRSQLDNVTRDNTPVIFFRLDDGIFLHDLPGNGVNDTPPDEVIPIPFRGAAVQPGYRVAVFIEGQPQQPATLPQTPIGFATQFAEGVYRFDFGADAIGGALALTDGSHFISARVEMIDPSNNLERGFGPRSVSLEIVVDTAPPIVFFGDPGVANDGLHPDSDSGVIGTPATFSDNITSDTTPTFFGRAEANSIVRLYEDRNNNGTVEPTDVFLGFTVALPEDGTNQLQGGFWQFTTTIDLNDPAFFPAPPNEDGIRRILATAEDVPGNVSAAQSFNIFLDTQGPQIGVPGAATDGVFITNFPAFDLFNPKPTEGPTPPITMLSIRLFDLPNRDAGFPEDTLQVLKRIAENPGHYQLVGDANGIIPIADVEVTLDPQVAGQPARAVAKLSFANPLPDDRFTLTVSDSLTDPAGNLLDGETNADEPLETPTFPTGDGVPGGDFVARFTVDTRAEIGVWGAGNVWVDINGNFHFDPTNLDFVNRDIVFTQGFLTDGVFAGNFSPPGAAQVANGFDKLAAYGFFGGQLRWLIDIDSDGIPDHRIVEPSGARGLPVAANFDGNAANGDEVGIFDGARWRIDTNHDFQLDTVLPGTGMVGFPIAGDFDGDGSGDLGTWSDGVFRIDLSSVGGRTGSPDFTFRFSFTGSRVRPVAGEMNADGLEDIGLWVADRPGVTDRESAEWFFLISRDTNGNGTPDPVTSRITAADDPIDGLQVIEFDPVPFGPDIFAQYGDDFGVPIVGNFDPPATGPAADVSTEVEYTNPQNRFDVSGDQVVTNYDVLFLIADIRRNGSRELPANPLSAQTAGYFDVNGDGFVTNADVLLMRSHMRTLRASQGEGEPTAGLASASIDPILEAIAADVADHWEERDVDGDAVR